MDLAIELGNPLEDERPSVVLASGWICISLHIRFPGLPKLLLSTTDLVDLRLWEVSHSESILPEAMVRCLSMLTRVETISLGFKYSVRESRPTCTSWPGSMRLYSTALI
jgi:hypothetical protein